MTSGTERWKSLIEKAEEEEGTVQMVPRMKRWKVLMEKAEEEEG